MQISTASRMVGYGWQLLKVENEWKQRWEEPHLSRTIKKPPMNCVSIPKRDLDFNRWLHTRAWQKGPAEWKK